MPRTVKATRYVTPLREGGSLPGILEADDSGLYVVKFRAAGQGPKALVAELISGELARAAGLRVPEIVFVDLHEAIGHDERDDEICELLQKSTGLNLGLDYLPGSAMFDPAVRPTPDPEEAARIVLFDAFTTNVDRTARNPNLLAWHKQLWLIDHGASLYFHHAWSNAPTAAKSAFTAVKDHVLLPFAGDLPAAWLALSARLGAAEIDRIVELIPEDWLSGSDFPSSALYRAAYKAFLNDRLAHAATFVEEAIRARTQRL